MTPFNPHYSKAPQATDTLASSACKTTRLACLPTSVPSRLLLNVQLALLFGKKKKHIAVTPFQFSFCASSKFARNPLDCFSPPQLSASHFTSNSSISVFLLSLPLHLCPLLLSSPLSALSDPLLAAWVNRRPREGLALWTPMKAEGEDLAAATHPPLSCRCGL